MKNKLVFLFSIFFLIFIILSITSVNADFTRVHNYITLKSIDATSDSSIIQQCSYNLDLIIDGNMAADGFVLHYVDSLFMSYVFTHTRQSGYLNCLEYAGNDQDLKCFCYGVGTHNVQDNFAHTYDGYVPKYLKAYAMSNLIGHMSVELDKEKKTNLIYADDSLFTSGKIDNEDKRVMSNILPAENGGDEKYIELLSKISGLPKTQVLNDLNTIAIGYRGVGFYNTVDKYKTTLPIEFWYISLSLIIIPILIMIFFLVVLPKIFGFKTTWWKFILITFCIILMIIGLIIILTYFGFFGGPWELVRDVLAYFPIHMSNSDVQYFTSQSIEATKTFFQTGNLIYDDVSGLSYRDSITGAYREGALGAAENNFHMILLPIFVIILGIIIFFIVFKTYEDNKKPSGIKTLVNILGWFILGIIILLIIYLIYSNFIVK